MVQDVNPGTNVVEWFGASTPNVQVRVVGVSTIGGYVRNSGGISLSGASVRITSPSGAISTAPTAASGQYSFTVYELGTYSLIASKCGYVSQTKPASVSAWNTVYGVDFALSQYSGIADIAPIYATAGGAAKPGADVNIYDCNGALVYSATTDSAGKVPGKTGLPAGIYTVTAGWTDWSTCTGVPGQEYWIWTGSITMEIPPNAAPSVGTGPRYSLRCPI
jgi:hypothetical protein